MYKHLFDTYRLIDWNTNNNEVPQSLHKQLTAIKMNYFHKNTFRISISFQSQN